MVGVQDEFYFESIAFNYIPASGNDAPTFLGEDLAQWLSAQLSPQWKTTVGQEDWGWYVEALQGEHKYLMGVYDLRNESSFDDEDNEYNHSKLPNTGQWCVRLFNLVDKRSIFKKMFSREGNPVDEGVSNQVKSILQASHDIQSLRAVF